MDAQTAYLERLRPAGGKRSSKRDLIVNVFLHQNGHLSADDLVDLCDHRWTIPMTDLVDSINVSAAAGIFLYTVFEQAQHK